MSEIALSPEQFIFAQDNELKTSSLKIAERFKKDHSNVLKAIDNILTQVTDSFGKVNFNASSYEKENNLGIMTSYRSYDLTKDGFMIVVMSFTGKAAMEIKEWYINAFNLMHDQLFPKNQYGLKELPSIPAPRAKTYIQGGLELHQQDAINDFIKERVAIVPANKRKGITVMIYSAICVKFDVKGMKHGYKNIAPEHFENIMQLISRLPIHDGIDKMFFLPEELESLVYDRAKALEGEVMPKTEEESFCILLNNVNGLRKIDFEFESNSDIYERWLVTNDGGKVSAKPLTNEMTMTFEKFMEYADKERGYVVVERERVLKAIAALTVMTLHPEKK